MAKGLFEGQYEFYKLTSGAENDELEGSSAKK